MVGHTGHLRIRAQLTVLFRTCFGWEILSLRQRTGGEYSKSIRLFPSIELGKGSCDAAGSSYCGRTGRRSGACVPRLYRHFTWPVRTSAATRNLFAIPFSEVLVKSQYALVTSTNGSSIPFSKVICPTCSPVSTEKTCHGCLYSGESFKIRA